MTPEQEAHLEFIKQEFSRLVDPKYRKGQEEHGGDLFEVDPVSLLDMALEETIDQVVYLLTLRRKLTGPHMEERAKENKRFYPTIDEWARVAHTKS